MQIDIDTGGGLPAGGLSYISGPDNAGKTMLLFYYFAKHQQLYGQDSVIAYAPTEGSIDFWFARKCGVKIAIPDENIKQEQQRRKLRGEKLLTKEEIRELQTEVGTFLRISGDTGEAILNNVLDFVELGECGLVAVDSIDGIQPAAEAVVEGLEKSPQQAAKASIISRFMVRYFPLTAGLENPNLTTLIFTGQVRANRKKTEVSSFMAKYMKDWAPTGAYAARHGKLVDLMLWGGEKITAGQGKNLQVLGKELKWELLKGKAGTHDNIRGSTEFRYDALLNQQASIVVAGIKYGAIHEEDGKLTLVKPDTGEVHDLLQGIPRTEFEQALKDDFELELVARREVLAAAGVKCIYR